MQSNFSSSLTKTQENMKQLNLCIVINLLFYTAIIQYMSQLLERQHFTAKMSPFWRYWHLCNENSAYATIASCAPSTRQGAIKLCRGSNNGTGSSLLSSGHHKSRHHHPVKEEKQYFSFTFLFNFLSAMSGCQVVCGHAKVGLKPNLPPSNTFLPLLLSIFLHLGFMCL